MNGSANLVQMTRLSDSQPKKKELVNFAVSADHTIKLKENKF